jgi:probable blue pigment (indigoidine) exporter
MPRTLNTDVLLTALAPAIWGSTYYVTTEFLPPDYPITVAMLRALPAGLLLLLIVRQLPAPAWLGRVFILGALNFAIFWVMLFITAYRLPGGVGATVGAIQPLVVILLAYVTLGSPIRMLSVGAAMAGLGGVALLVLTPEAGLDPIGVVAGLGGAASMALGTVLTRKWRPPVSLLTFTSWQLTAGGLLLLPVALWMEPPLPALTANNIAGLVYLGLVGAAFTYLLWFRGIARIEPAAVSTLGFLSPATALTLGWILLDQQLGPLQILGIAIILASVWIGQRAPQKPRLATATS